MKKKKIILIIALLAVLVVLIYLPVKASIGWSPGYPDWGPFGLSACICDYEPPECWCGRLH
jgi:hypothetical protein